MYVKPKEIKLGIDASGAEAFAQYVPIQESISALYQKYPDYFELEIGESATDVLSDLKDGNLFKMNELLCGKSFKILLYQDSFEVVNPLGSARTKHKIFGMYFSLANFLSMFRDCVYMVR